MTRVGASPGGVDAGAYTTERTRGRTGPTGDARGLAAPDATVEEAVSRIWHRQPLFLQHLPHHMYC